MTDSNEQQGDALLPCPWCGSAPNVFEDGEIQCSNKKCPVRPSARWGDTEAWNTRVLPVVETLQAIWDSDDNSPRASLAAVGGDWLPIATVPKNGDEVLLAHANSQWLDQWISDVTGDYAEGGYWMMCDQWEEPEVPSHWKPLSPLPNAAASSPLPAEPPPTCGPARPDDGSECAYGWCSRPRDGCDQYCVEHHGSQCKPPEGEQVCKCGLPKDDPSHSYTTEWQQMHAFMPKDATAAEPPHELDWRWYDRKLRSQGDTDLANRLLEEFKPQALPITCDGCKYCISNGCHCAHAPAEPEGEQERLTGVTVGSSRHPHFTHADHERMKATLDALPDNPTEEEAEAVLQVCGTSGKEVVNEFIERLLRERSEMQAELERLRTVTPPETLVVARDIAREWMNTHHASFETNQKREDALAVIITRYLGATNELVDEVQRRMDHVVETAVEWHQAGREGGEWFEAAEKLGAAINSLLELRDKPAPAPECFCGTELEAGLCPNGHDPVAATTSPSETAVGGEAERRSNHFSNAAIDKGFPAHIGRDNKAHYSDGTVLPAAGGDVMKRAHCLVLNWKQRKIDQGDLHPEPDGDLVCAIAAALHSGEGS